MKLVKLISAFALSAVIFSCNDNEDLTPPIPPPVVDTTLQGTLTQSDTLTADKTWILVGKVYVPDGITLTIEPGTRIISDEIEKSSLTIEQGAKIIANGTAAKPIVFTSHKAAGSRAPGDWGGLIILGKATTNRTTPPTIEGGIGRPYGGTNDADNSGVLRYVRIEYAGIAFSANNEINSLTLGGVGSGTTIEYVQTSYANDDAFEFFGGTVNCKYLISAYTADDDFDFDYGYRGKIQYAISLRDPAFVDAGDAGNGIESDNDGSGSTATPFTRPVLSNFTFVGPNGPAATTLSNHNFANRFRRSSRFVVRNSILMGFQKAGLSFESDATGQAYKDDNSIFQDNLVHAVANPYWIPSSSGTPTVNPTIITASEMQTKAVSKGCINYTDPLAIGLEAPFNLTAPNFAPKTGSPALTGATYGGDLDAFFTTGTYRGAVGTTNWLSGWTRFHTQGQ